MTRCMFPKHLRVLEAEIVYIYEFHPGVTALTHDPLDFPEGLTGRDPIMSLSGRD